jgi:pyrroline-5-carboxylate reductase
MIMSLTHDTVAFIGCGAMGEAMVRGLLHDRLVEPGQIVASHPRAERRQDLADSYGIRVLADNAEAARRATVVVICVKPQFLGEVLADLHGAVDASSLVMTIVAGVRAESLVRALGTPSVVRVMPNTPGQIGCGISVWTATEAVPPAGRDKARAILSALGVDEFVTHESELDMATALSGTGPAYIFLFMEALVDAGVHLGFSRRVAFRLVVETMRGAVEFAATSPHHRRDVGRGPVPAREGEDSHGTLRRRVGGVPPLRGTGRTGGGCEQRAAGLSDCERQRLRVVVRWVPVCRHPQAEIADVEDSHVVAGS